jgi:hypothetical protein
MPRTDFPLTLETDPATGQLLRVADPALGMELLRYAPGAELLVNGVAPRILSAETASGGAEHQTTLDCAFPRAYLTGQRCTVRRLLTLGGLGLHTGRPQSLHLRYQLRRVPWGDYRQDLDEIWGAPLEAPLTVDTLTVLGAATPWFGPATRLRAIAIGGSGPREHVSLEDGPVAEVVPWLQSGFRTTFPGQQTVPGALYYHPEDERWVWLFVRRPQTGGRLRFAPDRLAAEFAYFQPLRVHDELVTPEVSLYWGRGLQEAERVLAEQFDHFTEPPDWWYRTCWFWLHPIWQPGGSFRHAAEAVRILSGECGVTGYGIAGHDVPPSGRDIDVRSLLPSPLLGGDDGFRQLTGTIRELGGHSYAWFTRTGLYPGGDCRADWLVRGEDGRPIRLEPGVEQGVKLSLLNNADAGCRDYLFGLVRYYLTQLGLTGLFWDSGAQPMPPDFAPRPGLDYPGQAMVAPVHFYDEVYRLGRSLSPDFFMWFEGISTELRSNAFAVDNRGHGGQSGHLLLHRLAHRGPRRLVWRSAWPHDVAGAFPFINPVSDIGADPGPATYRRIAADPMNRWLCQTVRELGTREARGEADGVARLGPYLIVAHGATAPVALPADTPTRALRHVVTGARCDAQPMGEWLRFNLAPGAWEPA